MKTKRGALERDYTLGIIIAVVLIALIIGSLYYMYKVDVNLIAQIKNLFSSGEW